MQRMKNAIEIINHTIVASAARRPIIGGGGAPIMKNRWRRRPQVDGGGARLYSLYDDV